MQPAKISYKIYQGTTFEETYRWETQTKVYVPIDSISNTAPCVITTTNPHEMPLGWRFRVVGAGGMKDINNSTDSYYIATGYATASQEIYTTWQDQELVWQDARDADASLIYPDLRPWAGLPGYLAYPMIMNYTTPSGMLPASGNLAPVANTVSQAYTAWQNELATVNANTSVTINEVNSAGYAAYTSGGILEYNQPTPLTGYTARLQIRKTVASSEVFYDTTSAAGGGIVIDLTNSTINIVIPATVTAAFTFLSAVYSVELYDDLGRVVPFLTGNLTLVPEIIR